MDVSLKAKSFISKCAFKQSKKGMEFKMNSKERHEARYQRRKKKREEK